MRQAHRETYLQTVVTPVLLGSLGSSLSAIREIAGELLPGLAGLIYPRFV
jgi:hypothetical protein